jgi:hypothetical protein
MRTHVEFTSIEFPAYPSEDAGINPGRFGKRLAEFICAEFPQYGFTVLSIKTEDWGITIEFKNQGFPLRLGCGNYQELENGFLCFIEPSTPVIRKWFMSIETRTTVEKLATALDSILLGSGKVSNLRWRNKNETI